MVHSKLVAPLLGVLLLPKAAYALLCQVLETLPTQLLSTTSPGLHYSTQLMIGLFFPTLRNTPHLGVRFSCD